QLQGPVRGHRAGTGPPGSPVTKIIGGDPSAVGSLSHGQRTLARRLVRMTDGVGSGGAGFGIENLPFGVARLAGGAHACVSALAARVIDLSVLDRAGSFADVGLPGGVLEEPSLNRFLACGRGAVGAVRERLAQLIRARDDRLESALLPRRAVDLLVPVAVGDFV